MIPEGILLLSYVNIIIAIRARRRSASGPRRGGRARWGACPLSFERCCYHYCVLFVVVVVVVVVAVEVEVVVVVEAAVEVEVVDSTSTSSLEALST